MQGWRNETEIHRIPNRNNTAEIAMVFLRPIVLDICPPNIAPMIENKFNDEIITSFFHCDKCKSRSIYTIAPDMIPLIGNLLLLIFDNNMIQYIN